jgi:hypothetical protein
MNGLLVRAIVLLHTAEKFVLFQADLYGVIRTRPLPSKTHSRANDTTLTGAIESASQSRPPSDLFSTSNPPSLG